MTHEPARRMLELLSLLQDGRSRQAAELAGRLKVSPRTLRRDIDRLRDLGYPVSSSRGPGGSYQLTAGRAMPPLLLTDEEAVATVVGLRFAGLSQMDGGAAESALRKLEGVLPPRLRYRVAAVSASTEAASRAMQALDLQIVQTLSSAAHARQDVRFGYTSRTGEHSERRVEPYRQVLLGRRWYLLGWDLDRRDWRTFRLDRIAEVAVPGTTFAPRELPPDPVSFVQSAARFPLSRHRAAVLFAASATTVAERLWADAGTLEPIDEHHCRFVTAFDSWEWLAITLAMVGLPYAIEGPSELRVRSRELAKRIAEAAEGRATMSHSR